MIEDVYILTVAAFRALVSWDKVKVLVDDGVIPAADRKSNVGRV